MIKRILSVVFAAVMLITLFFANPVAADAASEKSVSQECVDIIKQVEGFCAIPFWDYSQWTVGFGTVCPSDQLVRYQTYGIPMEEANALMTEQLAKFEESVNSFVSKNNLTLNQGQFDALVSLTYNLGSAVLYNTDNRIYKAVTSGATGNEMIYAFSVYCMAGGEFLPGLMRRRLVEANMYLNGEYDDYAPENYCYVLYDANGGTRDASAQGYDCNLAAEPLSRPTYSGYTFVGWYTAATGGTRVTVLDENTHGMTLYAHWEKSESAADTATNVKVTVTEKAVNVRTGPGVSYAITDGAFKGDSITITGVSVVDGVRWGRFKGGWICLRYTNYAQLTGDHDEIIKEPSEADNIQVPIGATIMTGGATVYSGPHTTYPQVKTLKEGTQIEITEIYSMYDVVWGKCADGWVRINLRVLLHDALKLAHDFNVTVQYHYLNVRSAPGTDSSLVTTLQDGSTVKIMAIAYVGNVPWGRCGQGWISLDYTNFDASKLDYYRNHSFGSWYTVGQSSCVTGGQERRDCQHCDAYETRKTSGGDHSFGDWYVVEPSTCVTAGQERRDCKNCQESETRQSTLADHTFGQWYETVVGSCVMPGEERRDCQYCTAYETRESTLSGHNFGEWIVSMESTCVQEGLQFRICDDCGHMESQTLELVAHTFGQWYDLVVPTVDTEGIERRDCVYCGEYEIRTVAPTEHIYGEWYVQQAATCTEAGIERRDCQHCDTEFQNRPIEALGHSMSDWYAVTAPTCTTEGEENRICQTCGQVETRVIEALGHSYESWFVISAATCDTDGQRCRSCVVCTYMEVEAVAALGHNYSNWITIVPASCAAAGEQCRACQNCGNVQQEKIPALDHTFGGWYTVTPAACGQIGEERRACTTCGQYESRELMADDHSFGQWTTQQQATCTQDGEKRRVCSNCGYVDKETVSAFGHSYGQWYVAKEPTTTAEGEERRDCSICGEYESRRLERLEGAQTVTTVYGNLVDYYVNIRSGAGSSYDIVGKLYFGARVRILEQKTVSGIVWGRIGQDQWVYLTDYFTLETVEEEAVLEDTVYATVTVTLLNVRSTASASSVATGYLLNGEKVQLLEQKTVNNVTWGRFSDGWICLTGNTSLETVSEVVSTNPEPVQIRIHGVVTGASLNVRNGCGLSYTKVGEMTAGDKLEVLEMGMSGTQVWGRIAENEWVRLDGYVKLEAERLESVDGHFYGQWYTVQEANCTQNGQERRDCAQCGHSETRTLISTGHDYSAWNTGVAATCTQEGMEARVCRKCMKAETRTIAKTPHSYGQWNVLQAPTATQTGVEYRECTACGEYDTRITEALGGSVIKTYGVVTGNAFVNIRAGVGAGYTLLGTLQYGDRVEILEQSNDSYGRAWGRISENGWVCLKGYLTLVTVEETGTTLVVNKTYGTVTANTVNVRTGAGASYDLVGVLYKGAKVEILETKAASTGLVWGRISENSWVPLTGYVATQTVSETVDSGDWTFSMTVNTSRRYIYSTISTSSASVGYYIYGAQVEILEQKVVDGQIWARTMQGWILGNDLI